ncbi:hypothetical protein B0H17DRAFT_1090166 [Mycena rosella]|uniref:Uncharacterized protein n=1 Tax=Mycena rosella TaxID=1033263 RepID=A0AAD7G6Z7_MYCRO|nr:hypothetical protein B0H17DRAFT_1090166 [Mycena rosella]
MCSSAWRACSWRGTMGALQELFQGEILRECSVRTVSRTTFVSIHPDVPRGHGVCWDI